MNVKDIFALSIKNITRGRLKIFLTIAAVSIGIAAVIIISAIGEGGKTAVGMTLENIGARGIMILPKENGVMQSPLYPEDAQTLERDVQGIASAMPLSIKYGLMRMRSVSENTVIWGVDADMNLYADIKIKYGRTISKKDVLSGQKVAIIDTGMAYAAYKRENVVGKKVVLTIDQYSDEFEIIGIMEPQSSPLGAALSSTIPTFVYSTYTGMNSMSGKETIDQIIFRCEPGFSDETVKQNAIDAIVRIHRGQYSYEAENISTYRGTLDSVLGIITLILSATAGISLFIAGIGVMNTMLSAVSERRREVGICKAIGANFGQIALEFLFESAVLSAIGGVIGMVFGVVVSYAACTLSGIPFSPNLRIIAAAELITVLTGIIFGVVPAIRASKLDPINALREI